MVCVEKSVSCMDSFKSCYNTLFILQTYQIKSRGIALHLQDEFLAILVFGLEKSSSLKI